MTGQVAEYFRQGGIFMYPLLFFSVLAATAASFSGWTFIGHPGLIWRDGLAYAFASFYVLTIPITGTFFSKRTWLMGKRYGFITPGDMYAYYYNTEAVRWLTVLTGEVSIALNSLAVAHAKSAKSALGQTVLDNGRFAIGQRVKPVLEMAREAGRTDLLTFDATVTLDARSFPNGANVAEVEIDPETGKVTVDRYTVVDDFGNLINPMLAEGQVHGGVAQGIGQALMEDVTYDADGQILAGSFLDYCMPRADDLPMIETSDFVEACQTNPLGVKGCGEAGAIGSPAAFMNAVANALDVKHVDMPATPQRIWAALHRDAA